MATAPLEPIQVITNASMSGTNKNVGTVIPMKFLHNVSFQFVWTGTPNGSFAIEASNDPRVISDPTNAQWSTLTPIPTALPAVAGAAGSLMTDTYLPLINAAWVRPTYTNTSSSGTLNCWASGESTG